jgi:glycosyltransferase involved in cell wall biosynthesis
MTGPVSVVIPCFNAEITVGDTIESALAQTWRDIEVIVVDDGSSDRSADILRSFGNRIRADFGSNRGASAARNRGTALATGDYIQYVDSDDLLAPEAVESRLLALDQSGADVAYSDWQRFETGTDGSLRLGEIVARRMEDIDPDAEIACATDFWAPPAALLYRRRIIDAIGSWHAGLPVIQDARFLFDAARHNGRFVRVPGVSAFYRHASSSLSRGNERAFMLDVHHNGIEIQSLWESDGPLTDTRKAALAGIFDTTARALFKLGMPEFDDAVAHFKAVSGRRFGYPEVAHRVTQLAGRDVAVAAVGMGTQFARGLRFLLAGKR